MKRITHAPNRVLHLLVSTTLIATLLPITTFTSVFTTLACSVALAKTKGAKSEDQPPSESSMMPETAPRDSVLQIDTQDWMLHHASLAAPLQGGSQSTMLQGGSNSTMLQGGSQSTLLQGGSQSTMLQGGSKSTLLQGGSKTVLLEGGTKGAIIQGNVEHYREKLKHPFFCWIAHAV